MYNAGTLLSQQIWNTQTSPTTSVSYNGYTVSETQGSDSATTKENPSGTTVYSGTALNSTGYSAQVLGVAGTASSYSQLSPLTGNLTFFTAAAAAGFLTGADTVTVPNTPSGGTATIAIAAWNNGGGQYTSLEAAQAAGEPWGLSELTTIQTVVTPTPATLMSSVTNPNLSFSLGTAVVSPEPSTIALGVMGASAFLFRRRK